MSIEQNLDSTLFEFHSTTIHVPTNSQESYGFSIYGSCPVMIESLVPDSPADNAGLMEGDIIMEINGHTAATLTHAEVANIIQYAGPHSVLTIALATPISCPEDDTELYTVWRTVHSKYLEKKQSQQVEKSICTMNLEQFKDSLENVTEFVSSVPLKKKVRQKALVKKEVSELRLKNSKNTDRLISMLVEPGSPPSSPSAMVTGDSVPKVWAWKKDEVANWLLAKGLSRFSQIFYENNVTGVDLLLPTIDMEWLRSKGSPGVGDESCDALLEAIHRLKLNTIGVNVKPLQSSPKLNLIEIPNINESTKNLPEFVYDWTGDDVGLWLKQLHTLIYTKYLANFSKHSITGKILLRLEMEHLRKIGVSDSTHLEVLYKEILKLKIKEQGLEIKERIKENQSITQV